MSIADILDDVLHRTHAASGLPSIEFDDGGWAHGENVTCFRRPGDETLKQQALAPGLAHVEGVVWHYTDTRGCGADNLAKRLLGTDNKRAASWHACIDATGHISQSVSAHCGSWHAGGADAALFEIDGGQWSIAPRFRGGYSANSWTFGIELENAGELRFVDGKWCSWPFRFGTQYGAPIVVPEDEVVAAGGAHWHAFTDAQEQGAIRLLAGLAGRYALTRNACCWTHAAIDPKNRTDPGPAWTEQRLSRILDAVFGG